MSGETDALRSLAVRLNSVADELDSARFPQDGPAVGHGVRHALRQLVMAVQSEFEFQDVLNPVLHTYEQPWLQWGGPNPDNVYQRCAIDPMGTYELRGNVSTIESLIISLVDGDMHLGRFGVFGERVLSDLECDPDGELVVIISPEPREGNWIQSVASATTLLIRQYLTDWETHVPARLHVRRVDATVEAGTAAGNLPAVARDVCARAEAAGDWFESSVSFWRNYAEGAREAMASNAFGPPRTPPGGAPNIAYGAGWYALDADEVLAVEFERPDADYWSWTLHTRYWLDSGNFSIRQTSLNHRQVIADADGRVRIVVSATDPGVPNWIDVSDNDEGMLVYRYIGARTKPVPGAVVLRREDLDAWLPTDHLRVSVEQRREMLATRHRQIVTR